MKTTLLALSLLASLATAHAVPFLTLTPGNAGVLPPVTAATTGAGAAAWTPGGDFAGVAIASDLTSDVGGFGYVVNEASGRIVTAIAPGVVLAYSELFAVPAVLQTDIVYYLIADTAGPRLPGDLAPAAPYLKTETFVLSSGSQPPVPDAGSTGACALMAGLALWAFSGLSPKRA